jgi:hypothetical protein
MGTVGRRASTDGLGSVGTDAGLGDLTETRPAAKCFIAAARRDTWLPITTRTDLPETEREALDILGLSPPVPSERQRHAPVTVLAERFQFGGIPATPGVPSLRP